MTRNEVLTATRGLEGKSVLVTGASRGIGYAVAEGFARAGAETHILSSGSDIHDSATRLTEACGHGVISHQCDITDRAQVRKTFESLSRLDILINNAGLERPTPILERGDDVDATFARIVDINVMGTFHVTRQAVQMLEAGSRIIFTSSVWGKTAVAEFSAYCATKHANIGFMRSLAKELGPSGITVNAVCPGWVETVASMNSLRIMAEKEKRSEQSVLDEITGAQAMGGLMQPEDVVELYLFLASDAAANITGQAFNVDRGEVMS